jgi:hypothetical protein
MSAFSASDAALEGFQVLRTNWRVVVGWAVLNLLALVAMIVITVIVAVSIGVVSGVEAGSGAAGAVGWLVSMLGAFGIEMALIVGVYRLMLRPADPGFLHLRLGRDELRLVLVGLVLVLGLFAMVGVSLLLAKLLEPAGFLGHVLAGAAALAAGGFLALRFGLAGPISFAEGRIDFARSWRMTRGQLWPLLGMWFLNFCLLMLVWLALWLAVFVLSGLLTGFHGFGAAEGGEALQSHPGRYLLEGIIPILSLPAMLVLSQAPWVAVYRALAGSEPPLVPGEA